MHYTLFSPPLPPFLFQTARLRFREMRPADAAFAFSLNADEEVLRYTGDAAFANIDAAHVFLENYADYRKFGYGRWGVELIDSGELVGWCGLKNDKGLIDLGYRFLKTEWGKGYASEAAAACLHYGHEVLHIPEIIAKAADENPASQRVLQKIGMSEYRKLISESLHLPATWYISQR